MTDDTVQQSETAPQPSRNHGPPPGPSSGRRRPKRALASSGALFAARYGVVVALAVVLLLAYVAYNGFFQRTTYESCSARTCPTD